MALKADQRNITITVSAQLHDALHATAMSSGMSVSRMLSRWLACGVRGPINVADKLQSVRAHKDELFVSLPRAWIRYTGLHRGDQVTLSYSDDALIIAPTDK